MPFFGSSKHIDQYPNNTGAMNDPTYNSNYHQHNAGPMGTSSGMRGHNNMNQYNNDPGMASNMNGQGMYNDPHQTQNYQTQGYPNQHMGGGVGVGANDPYRGSAGVGQSNLPPSGALNTVDRTHKGHGSAMTGKFEQAMGTMLCNSNLKAKGMRKQQESNSFKVQDQEITQAEELERQARIRRERAVAFGAHPDNLQLGASGVHAGGAPSFPEPNTYNGGRS